LLPKSSKHYIVPTAEDLDISVTLVEDVVAFYYSQVREALTKMSYHRIKVHNLGTFTAKPRKLKKLENKYTSILKKNTGDTYAQMTIRKDVEEKFERVLKLREIMAEEYERKKTFLEKKYENK